MSLIFTEEPHQFVLQKGDAVLVIDRSSGQLTASSLDKQFCSSRNSQVVAGIVGIIDLPTSKYIILAKQTEKTGMLGDASVHRVLSCELIGFHGSKLRDAEYVELLESHLRDATLFFSPSYDLTSSAQRTAQILASGSEHTLDNRFFWNYEVSRDLAAFPQFLFPLIYGAISMARLSVYGKVVEFGVISRRSRFRAGTRYFRRGIDSDGFAANFNETEQLLFFGNRKFSFLQIRGSVPALWSEINNLKYKPVLRIGHLGASCVAAAKHFEELKQIYGEQFLVNLVNQTGYEKPVKDVYEAVVQQLADPMLHYIYFDFHHECSKMRWNRVQLLVDQLVEKGIDKAMWFESKNGQIVQTQKGIVRTNCMDCLDRTNVVQSTLALYALEKQLETAGVLASGVTIATDLRFVSRFRNTWADNADGVSRAYSGTGALKTDFTRTGRRTKCGALRDLRNSIMRYYRNNLRDGPRQDGYTLFLGDKAPSSRSFPFVDRRSLWVQSVPYLFGGCSLVAVLSVLYPSETHGCLFNAIVTFVLASVAGMSLKFMFANGLQYVNWPRLSSVNFVEWNSRLGYHISGEQIISKED